MSCTQTILVVVLLVIVIPIGFLLHGLVKMDIKHEMETEEQWKKLLDKDVED